jgi:VWFA-related protein
MSYLRSACFVFALAGLAFAADDDPVFRSDVALVRVDVQVVGRDNRAITGLRAEDFVLREEGRPQQIRNFAREDMPVDVLLLFDVSASMRPHVERIASAAHQALRALGANDRVAIMVFDRVTRVRLPFLSSRDEVERELETMLRQEDFRGGTDITRGMLDAADYVASHGRRDARRAIVILTDDQTEFERDDARVNRSLEKAGAVLSALIAPDAMRNRTYPQGRGGRGGGSWPGNGGGTWPGGGNSGGPLGGIIFGRRGGNGGPGRQPGGGLNGPHTKSAGTAEIARQSGGDSLPVDDASALETTLARIRQRYALHFHLPEGAKPGQERTIEVELAEAARRRYPDAELRFRRGYLTSGTTSGTTAVAAPSPQETITITPNAASKRKAAISEPDGPRGPNPNIGESNRTTDPPAQSSPPPAPGWRRAKPGEQP